MNFKFVCRVSFLLFICGSITGCRHQLKPGHYEGNLFKKFENLSHSEIVHFELEYRNQNEANVVVRNVTESRIAELTVTRLRPHELKLKISGLQNGTFELTKAKPEPKTENRCYVEPSFKRVQLCFNKDQFSLKFLNSRDEPTFTLSGDRFNKEPPFNLEKPQKISLENAVEQAYTHNIDLRIALEHIYQAKNAANAAWLNLIPHITTNLIWHAPIPTYISVIATLQGATPFVLPTFYLDALCSKHNVKVQRDALMTLQSDMVSNLEQLFYTFERDTRISEVNQRTLDALNAAEASILQKHQPPLPSDVQGFLDLKKTLSETIQTTLKGLKRVLIEDHYAVSQALGKHNPYAISAVTIGQEAIPADQAKPLVASQITDSAIHRSFEIQGLDYLIKIAEIKKVELYLYWLDPSADQRMSLGFNLIGQRKQAKSQIKELVEKREQLRNNLYLQADRAVLDYNEALENYQGSKKNLSLDAGIQALSDQLALVGTPGAPSIDDLKTSVIGLISDTVQSETALAAFRISRAKIDRLLLRGYSERLLPHLHEFEF